MFNQISKIEISPSLVAWYGATVATISVIVTLLDYWRDKARIKISYQKDIQIAGKQSFYDPTKTYFNITVVNKGRRPIKIEKAAIKIVDKKGFWLLGDSFANHRIKILTEENPKTEFLTDQSEIELSKIWYISIYDASALEYRKYLHLFPTFWRIWYFLRFRK